MIDVLAPTVSVEIINEDCLRALKKMSEGFFHMCVTSPPYFGLRDYGQATQIGLEKTPDQFIAKLVEVFREVRRVLRDDGTLWLNLGDCYATKRSDHTKPKDLLMIPARAALALQEDGWYLRSHIIWHKPNVMPESVRDRPTNAHESIFLLTKSAKYYYDADAVREPFKTANDPRNSADYKPKRQRNVGGRQDGFTRASGAMTWPEGGRNLRNVWSVNTKPFKGAHFATFPPDLIEPCIKAGCPKGGHVLDPFGGSGTTGAVARSLGRNATLIELNPEYVELARGCIDAMP